MKVTLRLMAVTALALLVSVSAGFAQILVEASTLPVTEPLDVGGTILQPGTYKIRVLTNQTDRNTVQITNTDGTKVFATVLTVPHPLEPGEVIPNTTFLYYPAGEGMPRALRTWFASYPPNLIGHEIVYEAKRAQQLARLAKADVVFHPSEVTITETTMTTTPLQVVTPEAKVETYTYIAPTAPVTPPTTVVTEETTVASAPTTPVTTETPTMVSAEQETRQVEMPATASRLPLIALLGVLSLVGALAIRLARG